MTELFIATATAARDGSISIDYKTLATIFLALLLAIAGFIQRSAARSPSSIECPNKVAELWPTLRRLVDDEEGLAAELRVVVEKLTAVESSIVRMGAARKADDAGLATQVEEARKTLDRIESKLDRRRETP